MATTRRFLKVPSGLDSAQRLVLLLANQCARQFELADSSIAFQHRPADVVPFGNTMQAGLLLSAMELRDLLGQIPEGRQALRDLGFEPVLQNLEGP